MVLGLSFGLGSTFEDLVERCISNSIYQQNSLSGIYQPIYYIYQQNIGKSFGNIKDLTNKLLNKKKILNILGNISKKIYRGISY